MKLTYFDTQTGRRLPFADSIGRRVWCSITNEPATITKITPWSPQRGIAIYAKTDSGKLVNGVEDNFDELREVRRGAR